VVSFIFVVAVLNLCLGFAVAVHLGRRYRAMAGGGNAWNSHTGLDWPDMAGMTPRRDTPEGSEGVEPPRSDASPQDETGDSATTVGIEMPTPTDWSTADAAAASDSTAGVSTPQMQRDAAEEDEVASVAAEAPAAGDTAEHAPTGPGTRAPGIGAAVDETRTDTPTESTAVDATPGDVVTSGPTEDTAVTADIKGSTIDAGAKDAARDSTAEDAAAGESTEDVTDSAENAKPDETSGGPAAAEQQPAKSPVQMVIEDFQLEVQQYLDQVSDADLDLRACAEKPDPAVIETCLDSLKDATAEYLENRSKAHMSFRWLNRRRPELRRINEKVQAAVGLQDQQIQSTNESIEDFDYEHDLKRGCRKMVGEAGKLMETSHHLRDTLDEANVEVARHENRLDELAKTTRLDEVTGLVDRAGMEAYLAKWWEQEPEEIRKLYLAMIDVDRFGQVTQQYGNHVGDRILHAVAQFLESEKRAKSVPVRLSGQRFLFLFPDFDSRAVTNAVERIRQSIEIACFRYRDFDIQITVSCAVVQAGSRDTSATLIARAETTLQEAKRYGRNRTFVHQGKYPTPLVPPNLSLERKEIAL